MSQSVLRLEALIKKPDERLSRTKKKCDGLVNNEKQKKSRQFSFSDSENATKTRHA